MASVARTVRYLSVCILLSAIALAQAVAIQTEDIPRRWHRLSLDLQGPQSSESATPNPFKDFRMEVRFVHEATGEERLIPGHFAADGDAARTGATSGRVWRAHFAPHRTGRWLYTISFRSGTNVAVELNPTGQRVTPYDGLTGAFWVSESNKSGRDHRAHGLLSYVGSHHLRFADGTWFLKAGADSPENLLAYEDFDNTPNIRNLRKKWDRHLPDWNAGDPDWGSDRGRDLIGALNYLANKGMNVVSFLTFSHDGDDGNVYPHVDPNIETRFDVSKLDQWEVVFAHADKLGLYLHFKTQETENDQDLDGGALGIERKLYYRELVSRFAHHLALNWNLGEENTNTTAQQEAFSDYIRALDEYDHSVVIHTHPQDKDQVYTPLLGPMSALTGASLQSNADVVYADTKLWRERSATAGRPWVIANDEQGSAESGILPDSVDPGHDTHRRDVLWGNLLAGGAGIESYFGYNYLHNDLSCQDFRSRDLWWDQCRYALEFFQDGVPFYAMENDESLSQARNRVLAGRGTFVVQLSKASWTTDTLDLRAYPSSETFDVRWFDPRVGGALRTGSVATVQGGAWRGIGNPPGTATGGGAAFWIARVQSRQYAAPGVVSYGMGCPAQSLRMSTSGRSEIGSPAFEIEAHGADFNTPVVFLFGLGRSSRLIPTTSCNLLMPLLVATNMSVADLGGIAVLPAPVPSDPSALGKSFTVQALGVRVGGELFGFGTMSDAIEVTIGH